MEYKPTYCQLNESRILQEVNNSLTLLKILEQMLQDRLQCAKCLIDKEKFKFLNDNYSSTVKVSLDDTLSKSINYMYSYIEMVHCSYD